MGTICVIGIFGLFMVLAWRTFVAGRDDPESNNPDSLFGDESRVGRQAPDTPN